MYYCEYAHLLKKRTEHTCMSTIYYDQESEINTLESKILDTSNILILSNLQNHGPLLAKMFLECLRWNI